MANKKQTEATLTVRTSGNLNIVNGNDIDTHVPQTNIMVSSEADLSKLADYPAGVIAFTAGYSKIWQKGIDGNWVEV